MKASYLRVGNLVFFGEKYLKCTVKGIKDFGIDVETDEEFFHCGYERIEPIPLTEEILLKCGFRLITQYDGKYFSKLINEKDYICLNPKGFFVVINNDEYLQSSGISELSFSLKIEYIHQLQNLYYALTGQELEIKL